MPAQRVVERDRVQDTSTSSVSSPSWLVYEKEFRIIRITSNFVTSGPTDFFCFASSQNRLIPAASLIRVIVSTLHLGQVPNFQAMAGRASRMLLVLFVVLLPCLAVQGRGPKHIQLFAHESRVPPSNTLIVSASPSGNTTGADEFGLIRTVDNVLRATAENDSTILGSQTGIVVVGKNAANVFITFSYYLNENATHQGTIAVHGHIIGPSLVDRIFAVVGGTGDFIGASGFDRSKWDNGTILSDNVVNIHNLTIHYPSWY